VVRSGLGFHPVVSFWVQQQGTSWPLNLSVIFWIPNTSRWPMVAFQRYRTFISPVLNVKDSWNNYKNELHSIFSDINFQNVLKQW